MGLLLSFRVWFLKVKSFWFSGVAQFLGFSAIGFQPSLGFHGDF